MIKRDPAKHRVNAKRYYTNNRENVQARQNAWYERNKEAVLARGKARRLAMKAAGVKQWHQLNPDRHIANSRRARGLPEPTRSEPTLCECCGNPSGKYRFNLDHSHTTGKFRGWLCNKCNAAIGALGDTLEGVLRAAAYLQRNG